MPVIAAPIKEFRVQMKVHLRFDQACPQWRQRVDELRAAIPARFIEKHGDWWAVETRCAPELQKLLREWGVELPADQQKRLDSYASMEHRTRDRNPDRPALA